MDVPANKHVAVTVLRRNRIVVEPIANQRQRRDLRWNLVAGVVRRREWSLERGQIALQSLGDRLVVAAQPVRHPTEAAFHKVGVQRLEALENRNGDKEVPSGIPQALLVRMRRRALSRCQGKKATFHDLSGCQAAATAVRHVVIAAARSARCVWAERRWRWTLKVLWTAAWVERNFWAEPELLNRCILRSRRRTHFRLYEKLGARVIE